jgi:DNA adenine methylase
MTITRPALRYHGGKFRLAPWIISHFPEHRIYTEVYAGGASVLLRKPRSYAEVINDLDGEIVNLFRVLRNPSQARELMRLIALTPYARQEFEESYLLAGDPIEQARRTAFRYCAAFATGAQKDYKTGFRANVTRSGSTPVMDWASMDRVLEPVVERLRGVVIENRPALDVLRQYDDAKALHYVDPPYVNSTRGERCAGKVYSHEMTDGAHRELAATVHELNGHVIISGYACDLYDAELYPDWQRVTMASRADGARERTEVLWISPGALTRPSLPYGTGFLEGL